MKTIFILPLALSSFFISTFLHAQENGYRGVLMKAKLDEKSFTLVDTAAEYKNYGERFFYINHFLLGEKNYFLLKYERDAPEQYPSLCEYKLSLDDFTANPDFAANPVYAFNKQTMDIIPPYVMEYPHVIKAVSGAWIMGGYLGNAFLSSDGSLYNFREESDSTLGKAMRDIIGEADGKYIAAFGEYDSYNQSGFEFYMINLDSSPYINPQIAKRVYFPDEYLPFKIKQLDDSLYLASAASSMDILALRDSIFGIRESFPENAINGDSRNWIFRSNKLIVKEEDNNLTYYSFNPATHKFSEPSTISIAQDYAEAAYDYDLKYGAFIRADSVYIFDVDKESFVNTIYAPGYGSPVLPFLDSEYVYVHSINMIISVEDEPNITSDLTYKLSAYPNPFNPQTTISFTIPNAGKVELAVYDILGRKATELLNEYRDKGNYEIKFNGANLASGIYFYTIKTGNFVKTNKLILLK
ncbi:MAG TPA: T9SS type A sorting domain-containing protein [Ignavibacteriales bacterium]|nr:T9SS type A sorting domain-containing protein [Ignavibacteriales bacterium]